MALINCPECGKQASDKAPVCPNCGYPISEIKSADNNPDNKEEHGSKKTTVVILIALAVILLAVAAYLTVRLLSDGTSNETAQAETVVETEKEKTEEEIIDEMLQGRWKYEFMSFVSYFDFSNGRIVDYMLLSGKEVKSNEGSYRIDTSNSTVYICWDNIKIIGGENNGEVRPNTDELPYPYTIENGTLALHCDLGSTVIDLIKQ